MNDRNTSLANLLDDVDCLPIRYLRDRVIFKKRGIELHFHPGTKVPVPNRRARRCTERQ
jgi:hypothetical protein